MHTQTWTSFQIYASFSLSLSLTFSLYQHHDVAIVRPLHDCTAKEVALFCYLLHLGGIRFRRLRSTSPSREHLTIDSVSRSFVQDINESLPSSNYNILASFGKLTLFPFNHSRPILRDGTSSKASLPFRGPDDDDDDDAHPLCEFCYLPRDERDLLQSTGQQQGRQMRVCRRCADCISA